jgi:phosphoglycerate dehydrogenase-like enzyme
MRPSAERPLAAGEKIPDNPACRGAAERRLVNPVSMKIIKIESIPPCYFGVVSQEMLARHAKSSGNIIMKILVTPTSFNADTRSPARERLDRFADEVTFNPYGRPLEAAEIIPLLDNVDGYIAGLDHIDRQVLADAPASLKVISRYGAGYDRVDIEAAAKRGIVVTTTPGSNAEAVADLTLGLMLAVARQIPLLDREVKSGGWPRRTGSEIFQKNLGIVGLGEIGKRVARAKGFSMKIRVHDPAADRRFIERNGLIEASLDELWRESDVITLHAPLSDDTREIVNAAAIRRMKPGVILINTARYELVSEAALLKGLADGPIGGLGLDVYAEEPPIDHPLLKLPNVVLTPHAGSHTIEARTRMADMAVNNLIDVLSGRSCAGMVTAIAR